MEYENFLKLTLGLQKTTRAYINAYKLGIDLIEFDNRYQNIISTLLREIWTEEGVQWLEWFMWESDFGTKDWSDQNIKTYESIDGKMVEVPKEGRDGFGAHDENGKPICYSHESTWEFLKDYEKNKKSTI